MRDIVIARSYKWQWSENPLPTGKERLWMKTTSLKRVISMDKENIIRTAHKQDVDGMTTVLNEIISIGGTTAHNRSFDHDRILDVFISPPRKISCYIACEGNHVIGFQALEWADPNWTGENPLPQDWAIISTYVKQSYHGRRIGRELFVETLSDARAAGVRCIDATIRRENVGGLAFYASLGFLDYKTDRLTISKFHSLT